MHHGPATVASHIVRLLPALILLLVTPELLRAGMVQEYVPLHVGNSWSFLGEEQTARKFSVVGMRQINGQDYFVLDDWFSPCCFPGYSDHTEVLFRYSTDADQLLQWEQESGIEIVRYDFSGHSWGNCGNERVATDLHVEVPAGSFDEGIRFNYATLVDCGIFHETLAAGVGPVTFYSSWQGSFELETFTIVPEPASLNLLDLRVALLLFAGGSRRAGHRHRIGASKG
jgi:hypothetical protein